MCRMIERSVFGYVADTSAYSVMEGWLHAWPGTPLEMAKWPNAVDNIISVMLYYADRWLRLETACRFADK